MDGSGYPRGLRREDMSVQARIMAIADIFEALTASDRPYKKGKKLSECLKIMGLMKKDQHIDPDIFEIFIRERVYLDQAVSRSAGSAVSTPSLKT
jgi:HD-GYP domain-containing protein (c-di-GMP phosphodiesterase class II)